VKEESGILSFFSIKEFHLQKLQATERNRQNQKQGEPFAPRTSDYYIKIVKVLSSLTRVFPMCIVALVLTYCAFTGAYSG
jgi:hypothetical protein